VFVTTLSDNQQFDIQVKYIRGGVMGLFSGRKKVINYTNGDRYDGEVKDGNKHGKGVYTWANGDRYDDDFTDLIYKQTFGKKNTFIVSF